MVTVTVVALCGHFNQIGSYWEKGNQNEIDIVAINDLEKKILLVETKFNKVKINLNYLSSCAETLLESYLGYTPIFLGLDTQDGPVVGKILKKSFYKG